MRGRTRYLTQHPLESLLEKSERGSSPVTARVRLKNGEELPVFDLLHERGIIAWVQEETAFKDERGTYLSGIFGVIKANKFTDDGQPILRVITHWIPANGLFAVLQGDIDILPNATEWLRMAVAESRLWWISQTCSRRFTFSLSLSNCIPFSVSISVFRWNLLEWSRVGFTGLPSRFFLCGGPDATDIQGDPIILGVTSRVGTAKIWKCASLVYSGDRSGLTDEGLLAGLPWQLFLRWGRPHWTRSSRTAAPGGGPQACSPLQTSKFLGPQRLQSLASGLMVHEGFWVDHPKGCWRPWATFYLMRRGLWSQREAQIVLGRRVFLLQFRRAAMGTLSKAWKAVDTPWPTPGQVNNLLRELMQLVCLGPLLQTDLRATNGGAATCSDASETGRAAAVSCGLSWSGCSLAASKADTRLGPVALPILVSCFNGIGGAFRLYDVLGVALLGRISIDISKPGNRTTRTAWPGVLELQTLLEAPGGYWMGERSFPCLGT